MKRASIILIVAVLTLSFSAAVDSDAGWFGKDKNEKEAKFVPRYDNFPSMGFHRGILRQDSHTGWRLDGLDIQFMSDCTITVDGSDSATLQEGRTALVTGPRWGNTIVAWRVRVMNREEIMGNYDVNVVLEEGEMPFVAQGQGPE